MGVIGKILGKEAFRSSWPRIMADISQSLELNRPQLIDSLLETTRRQGHRVCDDAEKSLEILIIGYELYVISYVLGMNGYIDPNDGRDFTQLLFARIAREKMELCGGMFEMFIGVGIVKTFPMFADLSTVFLLGNDSNPVVLSTVLMGNSCSIAQSAHVATSRAFNDEPDLRIYDPLYW
jgi:hypothetical protein